jgi:uncharacterized protein (DUF433 family)
MPEESPIYVLRTPEGGWRIAGTRVSLDSIVHAFWAGQPAEIILTDFPSLTIEQVYGGIAYYLRHRTEVDANLDSMNERWKQERTDSEIRNAPLLVRIREMRSSAVPMPAIE